MSLCGVLATSAAAAQVPDASAGVTTGPGAFAQAAPLESPTLGNLAGGAAVRVSVLADNDLAGTVTGNQVTAGAVTTGALSLDPNSFSGFNGIGNFVMNTGNNNNLQGGISVNIVLAPPLQP